jgi:hypothetical protein
MLELDELALYQKENDSDNSSISEDSTSILMSPMDQLKELELIVSLANLYYIQGLYIDSVEMFLSAINKFKSSKTNYSNKGGSLSNRNELYLECLYGLFCSYLKRLDFISASCTYQEYRKEYNEKLRKERIISHTTQRRVSPLLHKI